MPSEARLKFCLKKISTKLIRLKLISYPNIEIMGFFQETQKNRRLYNLKLK